MKCPFCRTTQTDVFNTRTTKSAAQIWRRRRCVKCKKAFTTYERPDLGFLKVAPDNGKPTGYSRARLFSSVYAAFSDLVVQPSEIDAVTDTIEEKLLDLKQDLVSSDDIARIILTVLKHFNTGAFVRYLSTHTTLVSSTQLRRELKKYTYN